MITTLERVRRSVARQGSSVVLRQELSHLGSSARIDAALASLVKSEVLKRIGRGVFVKTTALEDGSRVVGESGWDLALEAISRLGVEFDLHPAIVDYQKGLSEQVPLKLVIRPRTRFSRKLSVGGNTVKYVSDFSKRSGVSSKGVQQPE